MPDELYCYLDIAKGNMFCNAMFLFGQAEEIFGKLKAENYLHGLEEDGFAIRLTYYFSEINALHNGYVINFVNADKDEMLEASRESFLCEYGAMERLFRKCLKKQVIT